jgi:hypothetical protein
MSDLTGIDSEECIHGLLGRQCDICFPTVRAEPAPRAPRAAPRGSTSLRSTPSSSPAVRSTPPRATHAGAPRPAPDVSAQRVYHVTAIANLPAIAAAGGLVPGATPEVDVSSSSARAARATVSVPGGGSIADHVPFFATLESSAWTHILSGEADPRLDVPTGLAASDFAVLAASVGDLAARGAVVVADGDATHPLTRFADGSETRARMLRSLERDETGRALDAEVLAAGAVPWDAISVVTVANDRAKRAVAAALAGTTVRVAVHPPWFQREQ